MDDQDKIISVRDYIRAHKRPSYITISNNKRGNKEIYIRCPYCGDSKNPLHAHFYIELFPPFFWHCKKCEINGVLDTKTMLDLGIDDNDIQVDIRRLNKKYKGKLNPKKSWNYRSKVKINPNNRDTDKFKYDYFNKRFGLNLSREEINSKYRVITDFKEFYELNRLPKDKHTKQIINTLDDDYIGFLSTDRTHIVARDVKGVHEKRYHNLRINNDIFAMKFYTIKSDLDLMAPKLTLIMTEGIFDIIGVYEHLYGGKQPNNHTVFAAAAGKSYPQVVEYFMNLGFLDMEIKIYSDIDVKEKYFRNLKRYNIFMKNKKILLYYNTIKGDFGVKKKDIRTKVIRV